jgi:hypothetical protein
MLDPLDPSFFNNIWHSVASNNAQIFRLIFRPQPDNEVRDWQTYAQWMAFAKAYNDTQFSSGSSKEGPVSNETGNSSPSKLQEVPRDVALEMLDYIQGHLVVFPYEWLVDELNMGRFNFPIDNLAPINIFI